MTLRFNLSDVRRVVEHARAAKTHMEHYGTKTGPALLLVKDEGIYLMSNGLPRDIVHETLGFVAYAKGFNPNGADPGELHDKCREAVGGDDFSEVLPLKSFLHAFTLPHLSGIAVKLTAKSVSIIVEEKKPKKDVAH